MTRLISLCSLAVVMLATTQAAVGQSLMSQSGFGTSVAMAGSDILISEPMNQRIPGMLYVYRKDASGDWSQVQGFTSDDGHPGDRFGLAIEVDGDRLFASATRSYDARGAVYVFERNSEGNWIQTGKVQPDSLAEGDRFGAAIAFADGNLFVSSTPLEGPGAVFAFRQDDGGDWTERAIIHSDPDIDGNLFGAAIAAHGDALLVGSPLAGNGAVYVYRPDSANGNWAVESTLIGSTLTDAQLKAMADGDREMGEMFGSKLLVANERLLVAAANADNATGKVYEFKMDVDGSYSAGLTLQPFDLQRRHLFGRGMAISRNEVLIGAVGADAFKGTVYQMTLDPETGNFVSATKMAPADLPQATFFGDAIAAGDDVAVVGAQRDMRGYGSAFIYERSDSGQWMEAAKVHSELQVQNASVSGGKVKCQDGEADGFGCKNVDLVSFVNLKDMGAEHGVMTNDVWGWTDPDTGREYALVGRTDATSFVDISDPANPVVLGELVRTEGSPISIWRDIKTYKNYAFIVADGAGAHGVQIFDLTKLRNVKNPPVDFKEDAHYSGIYSAHNIVINEETGYAYTVGNRAGGETCAGGSHMINIQDPLHPKFAGCFAHAQTGRQGTGYTHDAQCVTYRGPDERYHGKEICFASNETALSIADVTDKEHPVALSIGSYPNPGYTHQGWLSEDQRYFFLDDELDEINGGTDGTRTLIWDVAELDDPILVNEYVSQNKASDHNLYVRGHYLYESNYVSGLRIIDIADVEKPVEVGYFDTVSWGEDKPGFGGSWSNYPYFKSGTIVVTSGEEGVFFVKRSDVDI